MIIGVAGQPTSVGVFRDLTQQNLDRPMQLDVRRGEQQLEVTVTPRSNPPEDQGAIGVVLDANEIARTPPLQALAQGFEQTVSARSAQRS